MLPAGGHFLVIASKSNQKRLGEFSITHILSFMFSYEASPHPQVGPCVDANVQCVHYAIREET